LTTVKPVKADIPNADWHGGANPSTKPIEAVTATPVRAKSKIWRQGKGMVTLSNDEEIEFTLNLSTIENDTE